MVKLFNWLPWRRRRLEDDLGRELRYHIDRRVDELRRAGVSEPDARRQVSLEFGGVSQVEEEVRDTWTWRWLDNAMADVRYAARTLRRSPGFTSAAVLSLSLGIGASTAIFSLIDQVLLRTLPVNEPGRLVHLDWKGASLSNVWGTGNLMSYPLCRDFEKQDRFFDGAFCRHPTEVNLSTGGQHEPVPAEIISGSYFSVLGVRPERGRLIGPTDDLEPGAHPVVVLSYTFWRSHLGRAEDIVGRKVLVNNSPMIVVGVAAEGFRGVDPLEVPALWIPAMMKRQATPEWDRLFDRRAAWMHTFARLKPGVTPEAASAGLQPWFSSMLESDTRLEGFPSVSAELRRNYLASTLNLIPASGGLSGLRGTLERPLLVLMGGTLLLVLMASFNVASLLLARAATRGREVTTRMALGASRLRITSQLLAESLLISIAGGLFGLAAAPLVSGVVGAFLPGNADLDQQLDLRVFAFGFLISMATGILCGLAPALKAGRGTLLSKDRSALGATGAVRLRKAIVMAQIGFALVLLIGAGLFVQTLSRLHLKDPGYLRSHLVMFRAEPDAVGYSTENAPEFMRRLLERLGTVPSVESAAVANSSLLSGGSPRRILTIESETRMVTERPVPMMRIGPGFFSTLGTALIAGREFDDDDTRGLEKGVYRSVVVNESFARRYFGGRSPVGHRVGIGNQPDTKTTIEIIGLVRDFSFRFVGDDAEPEHIFFPFASAGPLAGNGTIYMRVRGEPESALASIRASIADVDSRLPVTLTTLREQMERSLQSERMLAALCSAFAAVALMLCAVGLYGVMSFVVTRRTQEIGLRLALGATRPSVLWLIGRDALTMVGAGTAIALPSAWAMTRLIEAELFGVRAFDGATIALATGVLAAVGICATLLPAWRGASTNPTDALRPE